MDIRPENFINENSETGTNPGEPLEHMQSNFKSSIMSKKMSIPKARLELSESSPQANVPLRIANKDMSKLNLYQVTNLQKFESYAQR